MSKNAKKTGIIELGSEENANKGDRKDDGSGLRQRKWEWVEAKRMKINGRPKKMGVS